jgi:hypothetical protein
MPIVSPGESREAYVKRCLPLATSEGMNHEQASAACAENYDAQTRRTQSLKAADDPASPKEAHSQILSGATPDKTVERRYPGENEYLIQ